MEGFSKFKLNFVKIKFVKFDRLLLHLQKIARERNFQTCPDSLIEVQSYLKEEFLRMGFKVKEEPFFYLGKPFSNLIASLDEDPGKPRFIIGAHFDAVPDSPGADDNASGVVSLLETARIFSESERERPFSSRTCSVEFAAFNLEEYKMIGSGAYVQKLKREKVKIAGMLSLEMVGFTSHEKGSQQIPVFLKPFYPDVGNFIALVANSKSQTLLQRVKKIFKEVEGLATESLVLPANGWVFPDARLSDHSPFWDAGYPALLVTDTSLFRNPYYHTEKDRIETLDLDFLDKVTEAVSKIACGFARNSL